MSFYDLLTYLNNFGTYVGTFLGLITGSVTAAGYLNGVIKTKETAAKQTFDALEELNNAQSHEIKMLKADNTGLAQVALGTHDTEAKQGNEARAIVALEEWFEAQRSQIGGIGKLLAEHYISYSEPEIIKDALSKAQRAATLSLLCIDKPQELGDLLSEISILLDETRSKKQMSSSARLTFSRIFWVQTILRTFVKL